MKANVELSLLCALCRTARDWFWSKEEAGKFYVNRDLFHLKMAERNEAIMFSVPPLSPGDYSPLPASAGLNLMEDYSPLPASAGLNLMERVCASVHCGLVDTLLANTSFLEKRFLQVLRDWQSESDPNSALPSMAMSLLQRLDSLSRAGRITQKQDDRRVAILLRCLSQARALITPRDQASGCLYFLISYRLYIFRFYFRRLYFLLKCIL
jgi:hypothetical protein